MTLPTPPFQPPDGPLTQALPPFAPDQSGPTQSLPVTPPGKPRWPGAAKVTAVVLAVTTIGAAVAGIVLSSSARSSEDTAKKDLAAARSDLSKANATLEKTKTSLDQATSDLAKAKSDLDQAQGSTKDLQSQLDSTKSDLATAQSDRDAAKATADGLRSLFPLDVLTFAKTPLSGDYALTVESGSAKCEGYADNASACDAANLPGKVTVTGDATTGYSVSSSFFGPAPLLSDNGVYGANGRVDDQLADACNGVPSDTTFTLTLRVAGVDLKDDKLVPSAVYVEFTMGANAISGCTATHRSAAFDGEAA